MGEGVRGGWGEGAWREVRAELGCGFMGRCGCMDFWHSFPYYHKPWNLNVVITFCFLPLKVCSPAGSAEPAPCTEWACGVSVASLGRSISCQTLPTIPQPLGDST